jgi:hypothetical protein
MIYIYLRSWHHLDPDQIRDAIHAIVTAALPLDMTSLLVCM